MTDNNAYLAKQGHGPLPFLSADVEPAKKDQLNSVSVDNDLRWFWIKDSHNGYNLGYLYEDSLSSPFKWGKRNIN